MPSSLQTIKTSFAVACVVLTSACATTPQAVDQGTINERVNRDFMMMFGESVLPGDVISLPQAIARAIKYNLDHRLALMQTVVAQQHLDLQDYNKLPQLAARAGYTVRNKQLASSSFNLNTGVPNFGASTSQDESLFTADLELSWNTLDFGIAYLNSKQSANEVMIAVEQQRKVISNIVQDVRYAYWRMVSADRVTGQLKPLLAEIQQGLNDSYAAQKAKLKPLEECLEYQRSVLDLQRQMLSLQRGIEESRMELAALMGLAPGSSFKVDTNTELSVPFRIDQPMETGRLQQLALRNRPELIEEDYRDRIAADEVRKARIRWIPGIELFTGVHHSDNSFLLHNNWAASGYRLTWNILSIFSTPAAVRHARSQEELGDLRRMALSMAVLTQVDIAKHRLDQAREDYGIARELHRVDQSTYEHYKRRAAASQGDSQTMLQTKARRLVSSLRHVMAYADWQNAGAKLYSSIGYQPVALLSHDQPMEELSAQVEQYLDTSSFSVEGGFFSENTANERRNKADDYRSLDASENGLSRVQQ